MRESIKISTATKEKLIMIKAKVMLDLKEPVTFDEVVSFAADFALEHIAEGHRIRRAFREGG